MDFWNSSLNDSMQRLVQTFVENEKRGLALIYDKEMCGLCEACGAVCPKGILVVKDHQITITDPEACVLCGFCATACPVGALVLEKRS